jgi:hypothetical protein
MEIFNYDIEHPNHEKQSINVLLLCMTAVG